MKQHIPSLDGLRAIAITLVMLFHFKLLDLGWMGVQLFFVLSGFLITRILLAEKSENLSFYLKRFYWRRSLRIFPLYFGYLLLITLAYLITKKPESFEDKWLYLFSYTFNFSRLSLHWTPDYFFTHLWSLSVEEQFYLFWPLLIFFCNKNLLKIIITIIVLICPVYRLWLGSVLMPLTDNVEWIGEGVYWNTFGHLDAFALGAALTVFRFEKRIYQSCYPMSITFFVCVLVGLANYFVLSQSGESISITSMGFPVGGIINYQHVWSYTILNLFFTAVILYLSKNSSAFFSNKYLVGVGKVSYGMYVFHWCVLWVFFEFIPEGLYSRVAGFIIYYIIIFGLAYISFRLFEEKFLYYKDRFFKRRSI